MTKYEITTDPAAEPVSLDEAKTQLRVDGADEDEHITRLISVARRKVEQETGRVLISQTVKCYWDKWPTGYGYSLFLPLYPAASVTSVQYIDEDGASQTWASSNYTADLVGMDPRIVPKPDVDIPGLGDYPNAITVTYVAGQSTTGAVPAELKHAILTTLTLLYERREDMKLNDNVPGVRTTSWLQFGSRKNLI